MMVMTWPAMQACAEVRSAPSYVEMTTLERSAASMRHTLTMAMNSCFLRAANSLREGEGQGKCIDACQRYQGSCLRQVQATDAAALGHRQQHQEEELEPDSPPAAVGGARAG